MKYIFLDTNIYMVSAISTQSEHKIESLEKLKHSLKAKKAELLVPEIVKIEFERNIEALRQQIKDAFAKLEEIIKRSKIHSLPIFEEEKNKLSTTLNDISGEKENKFKKIITEIKELFSSIHVKEIPLDSNIFMRAYVRCIKREKPFKSRDIDKLESDFNIMPGVSWLSDSLIVESIIMACERLDKDKDMLIFCSNNIEDFASFEIDKSIHILHKDIQKDIPVAVKFYRCLPDMLKSEFRETISKRSSEEAKSLSGHLAKMYATGYSLRDGMEASGISGRSPLQQAVKFIGELQKVHGADVMKAYFSSLFDPATREQWAELREGLLAKNKSQREDIKADELETEEKDQSSE